MLSKLEIEILEIYRRDIFVQTSILQLAKILKKKSYQRVYNAVNLLIEKSVLEKENKVIKLTWTPQSIAYLAILCEEEARNEKIPHYNTLFEIKEISNYSILITGSYVKGIQKRSSDLDVVIIIPDKEKIQEIQKLVENKTIGLSPEIHLYVFREKDLIEMLKSKEENYGKETFKSHLILKNATMYYEIIKEAISNGFTSKTIHGEVKK